MPIDEKKVVRTRTGLGGRKITVEKEKTRSEIPKGDKTMGMDFKKKTRTVTNPKTGDVKKTIREKSVAEMPSGENYRRNQRFKSNTSRTGEGTTKLVTKTKGMRSVQKETISKPFMASKNTMKNKVNVEQKSRYKSRGKTIRTKASGSYDEMNYGNK
jgi:hypothetical protein